MVEIIVRQLALGMNIHKTILKTSEDQMYIKIIL